MSEEVFDVVDADDRVIGQAPRSEVHARGLLHRAVHIFVFNTTGKLLVHRRSAEKDEFPLRYTSSASGHLETGETYEAAAHRELKEELNLTGPIRFLVKLPASKQTANEQSGLFFLVTDERPTFDPQEIESGSFEELPSLAQRMSKNPEEFTPPFRILLRWYLDRIAPSPNSASEATNGQKLPGADSWPG